MVSTVAHYTLFPVLNFSLEWFTLMNKDKYCGEVYLELTFWSNVRTLAYTKSKRL